MSRRNREKRAAKQRERRREPPPSRAGPDRAGRLEVATTALLTAARCPCGTVDAHAEELLGEFPVDGRELDVAADTAVVRALQGAWEAGWSPSDLQELARRTLGADVAGYLREAIVIESRRYAPATLHPRWQVAVASISAGLDEDAAETPQLWHWAARHLVMPAAALGVVLRVLAILCALPRLERLLPLPGAQRHSVTPAVGEVDQKVLAKVRALLAKAESTEFPDEAEALSAKAQELMSRYSLHQAVLDHDRGRVPTAAGRRLWMDAPYPGAKALLVQVVATANRCRAVWSERLGFVTVVGAGTELDIVELLTTSLLVQANRAMLAAGRQVTRAGTSRTRSFRQSFLVAYATRIGERLDGASSTVTAGVAAREDSRLLPVLAARSRAADELTARLFPTVVTRPMAASDAAGWGAGRAAADRARFDVHGSIAG